MHTRLQEERKAYQPQISQALLHPSSLSVVKGKPLPLQDESLKEIFPNTYQQPLLQIVEGNGEEKELEPLRVGVVFSGGQAAGGHNVITGIFDALQKAHPNSLLVGFRNGPKGILINDGIELTREMCANFRNQGGFDLIGSGRDKIEEPDQFVAAEKTVREWNLNGLVIIGGDDSNTNAAVLAEYFLEKNIACSVLGVPKTIDGDLKNEFVEVSFGFDTAAKTYSEIIGNIERDALSAGKYYFFIKMMGRSASHLTLEAALQTHPNVALIGEEIQAEKKTLSQVVNGIADVIVARFELGREHGVVLVPEGIVEFIPEVKQLILELNELLTKKNLDVESVLLELTPEAKACFLLFPKEIQKQLLKERDPHGNVQVSKIETERFLIQMVKDELSKRKQQGDYKGAFKAQAFFCGYEGRSGLPSNFDSNYCYALGTVAAVLLFHEATGYMCALRGLASSPSSWEAIGVPLVPLMHKELRKGKEKAVIRKALVDLKGKPFQEFKTHRESWALNDDYVYPGPIQFFGPPEVSDLPSITLKLESS